MKLYVAIVCFLFSSLLAGAQSHLQWTVAERTPNSQVNEFRNMGTDKMGNTYTINFTQSALSLFMTYRFFCYDNNGVKKWEYANDSCFTGCNDKYTVVVPAEGNGAIFIGNYDDLSGSFQIRLKHISNSGQLLWQNNWTSTMRGGEAVAATLDHNGDLIVGFKGIVHVADQEDFVVAKFDTASGGLLWYTAIPDGGPGSSVTVSEVISSLCTDQYGNIYACGSSANAFGSIADNVYFKLSSTGVLQYKLNTTASGPGTSVNKIAVDSSGFFYLLELPQPTTLPVVRIEKRYTSTGAVNWITDVAHDTSEVTPADMQLLGNDVYIVSNYRHFIPDTTFSGGQWSNTNYSLAKILYNGTIEWKKDFLTGSAAQLGACSNALYIVSSDRDTTLVLNKLDTAGHTIWLDSTSMDYGTGIFALDSTGNVYISRSAALGGSTIGNYTQKFSDKPPTIVAAESGMNISVYPNPTLNTIFIDLPNIPSSSTEAHVFDITGKELITKQLSKEHSELPLGLTSGVYLLIINYGSGESFRTKIVVY